MDALLLVARARRDGRVHAASEALVRRAERRAGSSFERCNLGVRRVLRCVAREALVEDDPVDGMLAGMAEQHNGEVKPSLCRECAWGSHEKGSSLVVYFGWLDWHWSERERCKADVACMCTCSARRRSARVVGLLRTGLAVSLLEHSKHTPQLRLHCTRAAAAVGD